MGMKVKDIFKISLFDGTVVLGGKRGLDNEIEWFNLMEIVDTIPSLQPGEFLISTGFGFDDEKVSKGLIGKLKSRGLSGIGIQVGYYIKEIPKCMIDEGDELDFPVLLIPPKITFSHITKALYKELMAYKQDEDIDVGSSFRTLIADVIEGKNISYQQSKYLEDYCLINEYSCTYVWALSIAHIYDGIVLRSDINDCLKSLESIIEKRDGKSHIEVYQGIYIILIKCPSANRDNLFKGTNIILSKLNSVNINLHFLIGYSLPIKSQEGIAMGFREAISAVQGLININAKKGILSYANIEAIEYLQETEAKEILMKFASQIIYPIIKSDKEKGTAYYETLKSHIENNFNQSETAKELDIHRHTLFNRLEGLKKLLKIDYIDSISYLKYHLAIVIKEFYR